MFRHEWSNLARYRATGALITLQLTLYFVTIWCMPVVMGQQYTASKMYPCLHLEDEVLRAISSRSTARSGVRGDVICRCVRFVAEETDSSSTSSLMNDRVQFYRCRGYISKLRAVLLTVIIAATTYGLLVPLICAINET